MNSVSLSQQPHQHLLLLVLFILSIFFLGQEKSFRVTLIGISMMTEDVEKFSVSWSFLFHLLRTLLLGDFLDIQECILFFENYTY